LNFSPLFHSLGLVGSVLIAIASGGSVVLTPGFDAEEFFEWIREFSPTWFSAVPAVHATIGKLAAKHQETVRRHPLRFSRFGGASLSEETRREIEETLHAPVVQVYGMSECPPIAADPFPPAGRKPGSVGIAAGPEVAIWDDEDRPLGPYCAGNVLARGPNLMAGYYRDAAANRAAFSNGWLRTGDCGYLDEDGFLFLTGRVREFINRGGEKVAPSEVDEMFGGHPDVEHAVTFAIPDPRLGEEVATAIVPRRPGAVTVEQLTRFAATRLAFHKIPRRIVLVGEIPVGRTGKPDRAALRECFQAIRQPRQWPVPRVEPRTDLEKRIAAVWAAALGIENPGIHENFFDSGGDSLAALTLLSGLKQALGDGGLGIGILVKAPTIAELAGLLGGRETDSDAAPLPLKPSGSGIPLFWIDGFAAHSVVAWLDPERPVFLAPLPTPRGADCSRTIEQYAEECFRSLRRFRPKGPYLLAGWCAAGVVALEVARRLQGEGEQVGVVVFDARGVFRRECGFVQSRCVASVRFAQKLVHRLRRLREAGAAHAAGFVAEKMKTRLGRWRGDGDLLSLAMRHYRPKPYFGKIVHIWAADRPKGHFRGLDDEWGAVGRGGMELHEVCGDHVTMFQGENARALGRTLNRCLDRIERDGGWSDGPGRERDEFSNVADQVLP
jgi:thioesterase domain-containing protein